MIVLSTSAPPSIYIKLEGLQGARDFMVRFDGERKHSLNHEYMRWLAIEEVITARNRSHRRYLTKPSLTLPSTAAATHGLSSFQ
jgi:hypothetical protein